jgi:predicted phosphodiesterase
MPSKKRVLVIGDTHCPCMVDGYVDFLRDVHKRWNCTKVVHIGDLVDNAALSFHLKKPQHKNPLDEYNKAMKQVKEITKAFPSAELLVGNHDALPYRWCDEVGIPESMMRDFGSIFALPKRWKVTPRFGQIIIDGVIYQHGDRGKASAILNAKAEFCSVVQGHHHSKAGVEWYCNLRSRIMGVQVGCGTDWKHAQMEYGKKYSQKPVVSCGVILEGRTAIVEPMKL